MTMGNKKVLLFYNPKSGNGLFKNNLDVIVEKFQENNLQIVPVRASKGKKIVEFFEEMNPDEYRQMIVAGGDGTINVAVNAMLKSNKNIPITIFPAGTANDFASYFDLPKEIDKMIDIALSDRGKKVDVGLCNDKYFINVAALGNLVDVSQKTDPTMKNTFGILAYYMRGAAEIVNLKGLPVKLTTPDAVYEEEMYCMLVMNGISAGGVKKLSPESDIQDGLLNVILFRKMPVVDILPTLVSILNGHHIEKKNVLTFETDELLIESPEDVSTDVDGEHGEKLPLKFTVLKKELRVITGDGEKIC